MLRLSIEFTRSGNFAAWEGGGFNVKSGHGWSGLVTDGHGNKLSVIYERAPLHSKNHFLFRVDVGYHIVVCNIAPSLSPKIFAVRLNIGVLKSLDTRLGDGDKKLVAYSADAVDSVSFLARDKAHSLEIIANNSPAIKNADPKLLESLTKMLALAVEKAWTVPEDQRLFWGTAKVDQAPRKGDAKQRQPRKDQRQPQQQPATEALTPVVDTSTALTETEQTTDNPVVVGDAAPESTPPDSAVETVQDAASDSVSGTDA